MHLHDDIMKGGWNQLKGEFQRQYGKLTNDDLAQVKGESTRLIGVLQEKYGLQVDQARDKIDEIVSRYNDLEAKGHWAETKGKIREFWGELTDDEVEKTKGKREALVGLIEQRYGKSRAEAWEAVDKFAAKF